MNKSDLSQKWSKYCDTDKLVDEVRAMYTKTKHANSIHGVCTMLDEFFTQKESLIKLFITSKNYIGNLRISVKKDFERQSSENDILEFFRKNYSKLDAKQMLKFTDDKNKTIFDYLHTGEKAFLISNLPNESVQKERKKLLDNFDRHSNATLQSYTQLECFNYFIDEFKRIAYTSLQRDIKINNVVDAPVLKKGTKTSRAFNTVCHHYGVDKFNPTTVESVDENGNTTVRTVYPYNKIFAEYSDLVSDLTRKMHFVISLNPLDYLTMSNGVSWHSCHNIYNGCYKGGVLSYMLDGTSIVTFVVSDLSEPIHDSSKFYRQMFHYNNGMFMQNRLYPQGNDGAVNLYDRFRNFIIEEFSELLHENGDWSVDNGRDACKSHVASLGVHYRDYHYNDSCNIFYPIANKKRVENHVMVIGHNGICAKCGKPYSYNRGLSHDKYDSCCTEE